MATPEVKVKISADDADLKKGLRGSESALGKFAKAMPLAIATAAVAAAVAVGKFLKDAVSEAANAEDQMGRLGNAVRNAGGDFAKFRPELENTVRSVMKVSTATDDDLRGALTRMIVVSGDVQGSMKNLSLVADLAADRQIDLGQASDIVAKAMAGNTKGLSMYGAEVTKADKPLEALRARIAGTAEVMAGTFSGAMQKAKNQWGEFQEAIGGAILSGGHATKMVDTLSGVLGSLAGWVERNEEAFIIAREVAQEWIGALINVARTVYEVVEPALGPTLKVVFGVLLGLFRSAAFGVTVLAAAFKSMAGDVLQALGTLVEKGGALLKIFGIDAVASAGTSMKEFGRRLSDSATTSIREAAATYGAGMKALLAGRATSNRQAETEERKSQGTITRIHEEGGKARVEAAKKAAAERQALIDEANRKLEKASKDIGLSLADVHGEWQRIDREAVKATQRIELSASAQKQLGDFTKQTADYQQALADAAEEAKRKFHEQLSSAQALGSAFISAAQGMGLIGSEAASALQSLLNMGVAIAKFGIGSPEGILSIVGSLAQLIGGWGSSAAEQARKSAVMRNTRAIEELTLEVGDFNGSAAGRTFQGVLSGLEDVFAKGPIKGEKPGGGIEFFGEADLASALKGTGFTTADARKIAERYGIDVDKDPLGWFKLLGVMRTRQFGSPEGNFGDELAALEESFGVLGVEDEDDKIAAFKDFLKEHIPILADALSGDLTTEGGRAAAVAKLRAIYTDAINGKLAPEQYGDATPQQFRQIVGTLIGMFGRADGWLALGLAPGTGGGEVMPGNTWRNPSAAGGMPDLGGISTGSGFAPSVATTGSGTIFGGFGGSGDSIGVQITGDVIQTFNVVQQPGEDSEAFARRMADFVAERIGDRYTLQRAALGLR